MTRCSDLGPLLAALVLVHPAMAETPVSDAFGLYNPATTAVERQAWAGWTGGDTPHYIAPQDPDRLVIFAGPKSLVAGKDPGHVVAIVVDHLGNLVSDGTPSAITVDGASTATKTTGGIADLLLSPRTMAEDLFVGAAAGARQSPKAMLSITADLQSVPPRLSEPLSDAASDTVFEVASADLVDGYGNPVPDGTGVSVILRHADGSHSLAPGLALQDRALARFIARDIPGPAVATMTLGSLVSDAVPFSVMAQIPIGLPELELESLAAIGAQRLTLGPFLTTDGYSLADGAQVVVIADLSNGKQVTEQAWALDGEVSIMLPIKEQTSVSRLTVLSPLGPMDLTAGWLSAKDQLAAGKGPYQ